MTACVRQRCNRTTCCCAHSSNPEELARDPCIPRATSLLARDFILDQALISQQLKRIGAAKGIRWCFASGPAKWGSMSNAIEPLNGRPPRDQPETVDEQHHRLVDPL